MENTKTIFKNHAPAFVAFALLVLCVFGFWIAGYLSERSSDRSFNSSMTNTTGDARNSLREAANATNAAVNAQIERQTEDGVRTRVIVPKLEAARRQSQNSKIQIEKAKEKYSDENITHENVSNSRVVNCIQLKRLYPNRQFEYCSGVALTGSAGSNGDNQD
jgi:hypothetical protein